MKPSFVLKQVEQVISAVEENAALLSDKGLTGTAEIRFVDHAFLVSQLRAVRDAVEDSVALSDTPGLQNTELELYIARRDFLHKQVSFLQTLIQDNDQIHTNSLQQGHGLLSLQASFVTEVIEALFNVLNDNAAIATKHGLTSCDMKTKSPRYSRDRVKDLLAVIAHYSKKVQDAQCLRDKIVELRAAYAFTQQENAALVEALDGIKKDMNRAQAKDDQLENLRLSNCDLRSQLSEKDAEISSLSIDLKRVLATHSELAYTYDQTRELLEKEKDERKKWLVSADLASVQLTNEKEGYRVAAMKAAEQRDALLQQIENSEQAMKQRMIAMDAIVHERNNLHNMLQSLQSQYDTKCTEVNELLVELSSIKGANDTEHARIAELERVTQLACAERDAALREVNEAKVNAQTMQMTLQEAEAKIERLEAHGSIASPGRTSIPVSKSALPSACVPTSAKRARPSKSKALSALMDFSAHGSSRLELRSQDLATWPEIPVTLSDPSLQVLFSRTTLSQILGGSIQGLVVRVTESATLLARKHDIQEYLCPNLDHNPWLPTRPGTHGFMQVGLGQDRKRFNDGGDHRHVFVGAGKSLMYCGYYNVARVEPLTLEEWNRIPEKVRAKYSETTVNKEKSRLHAKDVEEEYNTGTRKAPCVRLRCVKFDMEFYHELLEANQRLSATGCASGSVNKAKKRKLETASATEPPSGHPDPEGRPRLMLHIRRSASAIKTTPGYDSETTSSSSSEDEDSWSMLSS